MHLLQELMELEERWIQQGGHPEHTNIEELLAPDFVCFGSTGRMWTRSTLRSERKRYSEQNFILSGATCYAISDTAALLTYRLTLGDRRSLRSSLWVNRDGRWQRLFHQGTVAAVQNA